LKTLLARIVAEYKFEMLDEGQTEYYVTMKVTGCRMKVHKVKH